MAASLNTAISFNNSSFANLNELFLSWPHVGEYWTLLLHHIREKMQLLQPIYVCVLKLKIGDRRFLTLCVGGCWSNLWCNLCLGTSTACIVFINFGFGTTDLTVCCKKGAALRWFPPKQFVIKSKILTISNDRRVLLAGWEEEENMKTKFKWVNFLELVQLQWTLD